jgi:hypothetical protein
VAVVEDGQAEDVLGFVAIPEDAELDGRRISFGVAREDEERSLAREVFVRRDGDVRDAVSVRDTA